MNTNTTTLKIDGMRCSSCVAKIEKTLAKQKGIKTVTVNLATDTATIKHDNTIKIEQITQTIHNLGYTTTPINSTKTHATSNHTQNQQTHNYTNNNEQIKIPYNTFSTHYLNSSFDNVITKTHVKKKPNIQKQITKKSTNTTPLIASLILTTITLGILTPLYSNSTIILYTIAILATITGLWAGSIFHKNAFKALKHAHFTMDTLVSLSILTSLTWSITQLFTSTNITLHNHFTTNIFQTHSTEHTLHFDSTMMITTFILLGRWIESRAKHTSKENINNILDLEIKHATIINENNKLVTIPIQQIQKNQTVIVKTGETIPVDGIIIEGENEINTAMLTGETIPRHVKTGDEVLAGTINTFGMLKIKVTKTTQNTMLSQIINSILESQSHKPKIQKIADKISGIFVPLIILTALTTATTWLILGKPLTFAISTAITILVIACPCALGLATPMAMIVATSNATKNGILIKNLEVLEQIKKTNTILFDKTGTLTTGTLTLETIETTNGTTQNELIQLAYLTEQGSNHPISHAITNYVQNNNLTNQIFTETTTPIKHINHAGCGIEATIENQRIYMGKLQWIQNLGCEIPEDLNRIIAQAQYTGSLVTIIATYDTTQPFETHNLKAKGIITFKDEIKPETKTTIKYFKNKNIQPILITGDTFRNATHIATRIGIDENNIYSETTPVKKKEIVTKLQETHHVTMIGDGINDAAALSQASTKGASISFAHGSDLAVYSSDITLLNPNITLLTHIFKLSKKTVLVIKQNIAWALSYNTIAITLAIFGYVNPSLAAFTMVLSSLTVILNSLRLRK